MHGSNKYCCVLICSTKYIQIIVQTIQTHIQNSSESETQRKLIAPFIFKLHRASRAFWRHDDAIWQNYYLTNCQITSFWRQKCSARSMERANECGH